jgi:protein-tyrosine phosphatase
MIDLHCHLLPNIDDGASNMKESLALARIASANGITKSIVTPHIQPGRFDNDINSIRVAFIEFQQALKDNNISLEVGMAAEVRICPEIMLMITNNQIPFLGSLDGYNILLLEMPYNHIPLGSDKMVRWLMNRKIRPIIVHPERNAEIVANIEKIYQFIELGCLLQITAGSLLGRFGHQQQLCAQQMLENELVDVIATDAHNLKYRPPNLEQGRKAAAEIIGETAAWKLVHDTPEQIISSPSRVWFQ